MREHVTMESPYTRCTRCNDRVPALARSDHQRIALEWGKIPAIPRKDCHREPMRVHRVDLYAFIHISDSDAFPYLGKNRLGVWKRFSVDSESHPAVVQNHGVVAIIFR